MTVLGALCLAAALLLAVAGLAKIASPRPTERMLIALRLPLPAVLRRRTAVRLIGAGETLVAAYVVIAGQRLAYALLALAYLVLLAVAAWLLRTDAAADCGCFGSASASPISRAHVLLNAAVVVLAGCAVFWPAGALAGALSGAGLRDTTAIAGLLLSVVLTWLAYLSITALPALARARSAR